MTMQPRSRERESSIATAATPKLAVVQPRSSNQVMVPLVLSLALVVALVVFAVASYPLWPRMYLSPVIELVPPLGDMLLRLFSTELAHRSVELTGGNNFLYMYWLASLGLFGVYLAGLRYARGVSPRPAHLQWLVGATALACALLLFAPTLFTSDLFSYIIYGRIAATYGSNPFVVPPSQFPFDPVYPLVFWKDTVSVYGPAWASLSYVLMAAVPPVVSHQVAAFKIVAILFHLANTVLIWRILEHYGSRGRLLGSLAYAWNPLLLIEFGANGHNDVVMLFLILLGVLAIVRQRQVSPLVFLTLAILTKWVAALLLPAYLVTVLRQQRTWRERCWYLLRGGTVALGIAVLLYLPYWSGPVTLMAAFDSAPVERFINSFPELLVKPFSALLRALVPISPDGAEITDKTAGYVLKAVFGMAFLVYWVRELLRARAFGRISAPWLRILFAYLMIACTWFWPWYISWLVPFAVLSSRSRLTTATVLLTFCGVLFYSFWPGAPLRPFEPYYDWRPAALFGLPLLYLAVAKVWPRRYSVKATKGVP